ncbi:hypothetical protein B0H10DRAFT_1793912 [Mycena sp. CBHHK59/15]|nr:hypothetical protein B0H10DRAFT_1793912 [Mycena sp. CBHHK59/15]
MLFQAFISFFFKQPKKKAQVKVATGVKRKQGQATATSAPPLPEPAVVPEVEHPDDRVVEEVEVDEEGVMDEGKAAHDEATIRSIKGQAIAEASTKYGLQMTPHEERSALTIFPKVAGLARRVHDSGTLPGIFENLVKANKMTANGQKVTLDRRVPTRWNSDLTCLAAHVHFETPVKQLTSTETGLSQYALTAEQWKLTKELKEVLEIFKDLTRLFSQAEVPLIYEVIPMLERLEEELTNVRDDPNLPTVIRIAAVAGLLVVGKYYALTDDAEVYRIAIIMCPDKKLDWFNTNPGWLPADRVEAEHIVRQHWEETYAPRRAPEATEASSQLPPAVKVCT